jgi:N-acetyl-gamma-glutamyl-phosphate reductase
MSAVTTVGVVGASGYSGAVFTQLVLHHPELELRFATSVKRVGESISDDCKLQYRAHDDATRLAREVDVVVLATSAEHSTKLAPEISEHARVVDLSGAFRLERHAYPKWYGFEHPSPDALAHAFYGLPELFGAPPDTTRIVANPGCYATAALLAIAPLVREGVARADRIIVDGKSAISGAGRRADESHSFVELDEQSRAYKIGAHQHTPEIVRGLSRFAKCEARLTFTPHLVPARRGLIVTAYSSAAPGATDESIRRAFEKTYEGSRFAKIVSPEDATMHAAAGTPNAYVGARLVDDVIVSVCAIDNLLKGAASQAMQNLNLMFGKNEDAGLDRMIRFAP